MKILLVSPHFYPENFKCNDVAFQLAAEGHDVTVLSDIPNYPLGKFYKGYGVFSKRREVVNSVKIWRALVIPRGKGSGFRLLLNYLSFAFFASIDALYFALFQKFDAILVHETSPITVGIPALWVKKIQRIPMYFWVLDLWPESLSAAGGIKNKFILNTFAGLAKLLYRNSKKILISSRGFRKSILEKGDFADRLVYFPNWAEDVFLTHSTSVIPPIPEGFVVMFAGNIGDAQDFEHIIAAANILRHEKDIHFVIVGDGRKRKWTENLVKTQQLNDTVHFLGRYPVTAMPAFFQQASAMLLALKSDPIFNLTVPAKLQAYMAAGKPILGMIDGEANDLICESQCGYAAASGDSKALAENILKMKQMSAMEFSQFSQASQAYYQKYFSKAVCMKKLNEVITS